jgi:copper chaperone CopZ
MKNSIRILALLLAASTTRADTIEMKVNGLVCGFCAQGIDKTLRKIPATTDVIVSLEHKLVAIATRQGEDISDADLTRALTDSGYDVRSITRTRRSLAEIRAELAQSGK